MTQITHIYQKNPVSSPRRQFCPEKGHNSFPFSQTFPKETIVNLSAPQIRPNFPYGHWAIYPQG